MTYDPTSGPHIKNLGTFSTLSELNSTHPATLYVPGTTAYTLDQGLLITNGSTWSAVSSGTPSGLLLNTVGVPIKLTGNGTYTPSAGANSIFVIAVGDGGSGGGAGFTSSGCVGGGGGAGAVCMGYFLLSALTAPISYSVGAGAAAGSAGAAGAAGAGTTISDASSTLNFTANGGQAGILGVDANLVTNGANPSQATGGQLNISGGAGGIGVKTVGSTNGQAGVGGSSPYGTGGSGPHSVGNGGLGAGYGGGGGGGFATTSAKAGGAGAAGIILIYEYT